MDTDAKWYEVVKAQHAIYTIPEKREIISRNLVMLQGCTYRVFEYPKDGIKCYLLEAGDRVLIKGNPHDGEILMTR